MNYNADDNEIKITERVSHILNQPIEISYERKADFVHKISMLQIFLIFSIFISTGFTKVIHVIKANSHIEEQVHLVSAASPSLNNANNNLEISMAALQGYDAQVIIPVDSLDAGIQSDCCTAEFQFANDTEQNCSLEYQININNLNRPQ